MLEAFNISQWYRMFIWLNYYWSLITYNKPCFNVILPLRISLYYTSLLTYITPDATCEKTEGNMSIARSNCTRLKSHVIKGHVIKSHVIKRLICSSAFKYKLLWNSFCKLKKAHQKLAKEHFQNSFHKGLYLMTTHVRFHTSETSYRPSIQGKHLAKQKFSGVDTKGMYLLLYI